MKLIKVVILFTVFGLCLAGNSGDKNGGDKNGGDNNGGDNNPKCVMTVPAAPLTAQGLATPYIYKNCDMADIPSFVQASILDLDTATISVYSPLVINDKTKPLIDPVIPELPNNHVVGIWFGSNGDMLQLEDRQNSLQDGNCVNGLKNSVFGQFAYCNAVEFFTAYQRIADRVIIDPIGTAIDGLPCPTTWDYMVVDADPSDNLQTTYLLVGKRTAQDTAANRAALKNATILTNPSDERLLSNFINPIMRCKSMVGVNLADPAKKVASLAINEIQALQQKEPLALIPANNPMVLVNGKPNLEKLNLYRVGVHQNPVNNLAEASGAAYCVNMVTAGATRIQNNKDVLSLGASPDIAAANNLFTFLAVRFVASLEALNCIKFGVVNPVNLVMDGDIAIDANFNI